MKMTLKNFFEKPRNIVIMILIMVVVILSFGGCHLSRRDNADSGSVGSVGRAFDQTDYNLKVMLSCPDNWRQISSEQMLSRNDFAQIDGSRATIPITAELARQFCGVMDDKIVEYVSHNSTLNAYLRLISRGTNYIGWQNDESYYEDTVRLIFVTQPSDEELEMAQNKGFEFEIEPVAIDGFVFITHKDNPIDSLTVQQVRDIYSGKITNWSEVGGMDEEICAFQREKYTENQTAMEQLVMQGEPLADAPMYIDLGLSGVAEYENDSFAIGYTYRYYLNNLYKNPDIKVLNIGGVSPDNENLLSGEYPFVTSYYAVMRSDEPEDSKMRRLRDYMLSDEGQQIVELAGFCPVVGAG